MISPEVAQRIKELEIYTRRLVSGSHVGDNSSAYKGVGLDFDQIRDYQQGDDIRFIDWKGSARSGKLLVKQYIEERNRTIILAVDCSQSNFFGSLSRLKYDCMTEIAAILSLVSCYGKDNVGLLLFAEQVECYIPPHKGQHHIQRILNTLFTFKPNTKKTSINTALEYLAQLKKRNALVFLISDFFDVMNEKTLHYLTKMYEMVAIKIMDNLEQQIPAVGFLTIQDIESGSSYMIDLRKKNKKNIEEFLHNIHMVVEKQFLKYRIDMLAMKPESSSLGNLVLFFRRRMRY